MNPEAQPSQWADVCARYQTPFYFYDGDLLQQRYETFRSLLHPAADLFLSLKANNNVSIAKLYRQWGSGIEVASKGELLLAERAGFEPGNILFSGPGKRAEELLAAMEAGVYCIILDSVEELRLLSDLALAADKTIHVGVRVNPDRELSKATIKMAGAPRQFGIDEGQLAPFFTELRKRPCLKFRGVHVYTGTQILNAAHLLQSFAYTMELAREVKERYGFVSEMIDMGGGFGVAYFAQEQDLDLPALLAEVNQLIEQARVDFPSARFVIESGRYLLAEGGRYITKVLYSKVSKGETFHIVDGGLHHHMAATFRGRTMRNNFPALVVAAYGEGSLETAKAHIVGPLCTPEDCLLRNVELPIIQPGDFISIEKAGAYGLSYSPQQFLGHNTPLEVLRWQGREWIIRTRGTDEQLLLNQQIFSITDELEEAR